MHNTGRDFEALAGIINKALIGQDATVIRNHRMINSCGLEREIDVYIETPNKKTVIECKDWRHRKNDIKLELIDAYYGKTSLLENINRRIFVARGRYQRGAKQLANCLGIDLYRLEEINENVVLDWLDITQAKKMRVNWVLVQTSLIVEHNGQKILILNVESNTNLYVENQGTFTLSFIIKNNLAAYHEEEENLCLEMQKKEHLSFWQEKFFPVENKKIIYTYNGQDFTVFSLRCICVYEIEIHAVKEHTIWEYKDGLFSSVVAQAVNIVFNDNIDKKYHLVKNSETGEETMLLEEIVDGKKVHTSLIGRDYTFRE